MKYADLHLHTYFSDGMHSIDYILKECKKNNISALSITDHDCIEALKEAKVKCNNEKLDFVNGVEIQGILTEVLGYYFDEDDNSLMSLLEKNRISREKYLFEFVDKLQELNYDICYEDVLEQAPHSKIIMKTHIAKVFVNNKKVKTIQEAFDKHFSKIKIRSPIKLAEPKKIIKTIVNAGGVCVLPHPWFLPQHIKDNINGFITKLIKYGLSGIETTGYCPEQHIDFINTAKNLAKDYNLIETGGSDFHGLKITPNNIIGKYSVNYNTINELKKRLI